MHAIGSPVRRRLLTVYTISAALAGVAGALLAQTTQFVGLTVLGFQRSGEIVIMLVFGGVGRLYGAFVGASLYMIAQDQIAKLEPEFWNFWIGLLSRTPRKFWGTLFLPHWPWVLAWAPTVSKVSSARAVWARSFGLWIRDWTAP